MKKKDNFNVDRYTKALTKFSNSTYLEPFKANGYYVEDRRGDTVVECNNTELAKTLAELLNNLPNPELLQTLPLAVESGKVEKVEKPVEKITPIVTETIDAKIKKFF